MRHAVILAGGSGKRFWPRSRRARPKQFMTVGRGLSLLQETARRLGSLVPAERTWVITAERYVARVREDLPALPGGNVVGEPRALNTGPAIGVAAVLARRQDPDAVLVVQAADHHIADVPAFRRLVRAAFAEVERGRAMVLTGFKPARPATGYGYIEVGRRLSAARGTSLYEARSYREKPPARLARRFLASGRYLWNGCVFFWRADTVLAGIAEHMPDLHRGLVRFERDLDRGKAVSTGLAALYRKAPAVAIEYGLVEKAAGKVVIAGDCGWEDVGTWNGLARLVAADAHGNAVLGRHFGLDSAGSVIISDQGLVATLGVKDLIVVRDGDAVLVLPRERESELRGLIEAMEARRELAPFL